MKSNSSDPTDKKQQNPTPDFTYLQLVHFSLQSEEVLKDNACGKSVFIIRNVNNSHTGLLEMTSKIIYWISFIFLMFGGANCKYFYSQHSAPGPRALSEWARPLGGSTLLAMAQSQWRPAQQGSVCATLVHCDCWCWWHSVKEGTW